MALSSKDRAVLFGTTKLGIQIQKYIEAKKQVGYAELCAAFVGEQPVNIRSAIHRLVVAGAVRKTEGVYEATYDHKPKGWKADNAWKAARVLRTFTADDIARISEVGEELAKWLCNQWKLQENIVVIGRNGRKPIYRLLNDSPIRPDGRRYAHDR